MRAQGISAADLTRLFVPFERLEAADGAVGGVGLGLVVSRRLAEAMGGNLGVESRVGQASTFRVELPMADSGKDLFPGTAIQDLSTLENL